MIEFSGLREKLKARIEKSRSLSKDSTLPLQTAFEVEQTALSFFVDLSTSSDQKEILAIAQKIKNDLNFKNIPQQQKNKLENITDQVLIPFYLMFIQKNQAQVIEPKIRFSEIIPEFFAEILAGESLKINDLSTKIATKIGVNVPLELKIKIKPSLMKKVSELQKSFENGIYEEKSLRDCFTLATQIFLEVYTQLSSQNGGQELVSKDSQKTSILANFGNFQENQFQINRLALLKNPDQTAELYEQLKKFKVSLEVINNLPKSEKQNFLELLKTSKNPKDFYLKLKNSNFSEKLKNLGVFFATSLPLMLLISAFEDGFSSIFMLIECLLAFLEGDIPKATENIYIFMKTNNVLTSVAAIAVCSKLISEVSKLSSSSNVISENLLNFMKINLSTESQARSSAYRVSAMTFFVGLLGR
jgi:hypothetical protein